MPDTYSILDTEALVGWPSGEGATILEIGCAIDFSDCFVRYHLIAWVGLKCGCWHYGFCAALDYLILVILTTS